MKGKFIIAIVTFILTTLLWFVICPIIDNDFLEKHNIIVKTKNDSLVVKGDPELTSDLVITLYKNGQITASYRKDNNSDTITINSKEELKTFFKTIRKFENDKDITIALKVSKDEEYKNVRELMNNMREIGEDRWDLLSY